MLNDSLYMFKKILSENSNGNNPFKPHNNSTTLIQQYPNDNSFKEQNEIRCPICLKLAWRPIKPNVCNHVFCKNCLKYWSKIKKNCPICRKEYKYVIDVDLYDFSYDFQGSLFVH